MTQPKAVGPAQHPVAREPTATGQRPASCNINTRGSSRSGRRASTNTSQQLQPHYITDKPISVLNQTARPDGIWVEHEYRSTLSQPVTKRSVLSVATPPPPRYSLYRRPGGSSTRYGRCSVESKHDSSVVPLLF